MDPLSVLFYVAGNVLRNVVSLGTDLTLFFQRDAGLALMAQKRAESEACPVFPSG